MAFSFGTGFGFRLGLYAGQAQNYFYISDSANQSEQFITSDNHAFVVKK